MSTINVNTISNAAGSGAPNFPDGVQVAGNNVPTAGSFSNRNKIINGNFDIWQRGTSGTSGYVADRWTTSRLGSTVAISRESFTLGQTDVPNEPRYFFRHVVTSVAGSGNLVTVRQAIENVRTFAGQTVTLSFWAKADATKNIAVEFNQDFGTGGSPSSDVDTIGVTTINLTSSWQKFTVTATLPSISGKTLGTAGGDHVKLFFWFDAGSDWNSRNNSLGQQSGTFDIAQVQLEAGDVATPFEMRFIGQELALCQRYYFAEASTNFGAVYSTGNSMIHWYFPVVMRTFPTISYTQAGGGTFNNNYINDYKCHAYYTGDTTISATLFTADAEL